MANQSAQERAQARTEALESNLYYAFEELGVPSESRDKFIPYLDLLRQKDEATWAHSVRVGLLGKAIAEYRHDDPKALFLPGIVHDVGKLLIDPRTLRKTEGFNEQDKKMMDEHPSYGYKLLEGVAPFSALVAYYHHYFGAHGYPRKRSLPELEIEVPFSEDTVHWAKECARMVSIADFWDAVRHRKNDKYSPGKPRLPKKAEALEILAANSGPRAHLVQSLYDDGILS